MGLAVVRNDEKPRRRNKRVFAELKEAEFKELAQIIYQKFGIDLPSSKKELIPRRLGKRLATLGLADYGEYVSYLKDNWQSEEQTLANAITTNLTSFFREPHHFDFLENNILPYIFQKNSAARKLRVWSAGCSTGEEPYSIAMTLQRHNQTLRHWDTKILATDLDTNILQTAYTGRYQGEQLAKVPAADKARWCHLVDEVEDFYDIDAELKKVIAFKRLNFMDSWPMKGKFDLIFCRNVLIYFDQKTQQRVLDGFARYQNTGDYLIVGHSENLLKVTDNYELVGKTIYRKK